MSKTNEEDDIEMSSVEFTLEDTYEHLKDLKTEREQEVIKLMNVLKNNEVRTLGPHITPEEIRKKRLKFVYSMAKLVEKEQPKDFPISGTPDFYNDALKELEDEVQSQAKLEKFIDADIEDIEKDITYMEKKKAAFAEMKEASLLAAENEAQSNYEAEMVVTKKLFQKVKNDLENVVDVLFPDNGCFQDLLCILTRALSKGGDDLYIDVSKDTFDFALFLEEADIVQFHPNDKKKIKLRNL
ncbi:uncharacterized protein LOC131672408 isoform X2 [Phymastichus coffea]|nr:uncharacterized protein LOC131672408 isoform X2 [Phymastichus coffea]